STRVFLFAEATDLPYVDCGIRPGACGNPMVGRIMGRAAPRRRSNHQAAGAAAAALSFRADRAGRLDPDRVSGFCNAVDADFVGHWLCPDADVQMVHGARRSRQKSYRPKPRL